ncbi:hypothetical protein F441_15153 [Phytophthora nicotianae CJ01A1]|uniref:Uncharacterized protein n=1 Tax=Phytophthora nicotianae CJ01A1 TaxID=1317063 RepID=W2WFQ8_PHYNI|nr:hypothetical protein F441_15153 [Phytophthora nicotianae CJ01A1]
MGALAVYCATSHSRKVVTIRQGGRNAPESQELRGDSFVLAVSDE